MLTQPLLQQLHELRLTGMAAALEHQLAGGLQDPLSFEDRLGLLIQHGLSARAAFRLAQRLRYHNAYKINLKGDSMRKRKNVPSTPLTTTPTAR